MEWLFDPAIWIGLLTLVVLEIVLGIDNLVFIAILTNKLPSKERNKARLTGLTLAMVMRLAMLSILSWMVTLTKPVLTVYSLSFSGRDLILLIGGVFLLFKATMELHDRLEGRPAHQETQRNFPSFWVVVAQIVVLDMIFSIDSVITAIGIVSHLAVMMAAVIIAVSIMLWASKPLMDFVGRHQTVVVLCLAFLLMIGLSLIAESVGFVIPKGYLYACIGFSVMIEMFNQIAKHNFMKHMAQIPLRDRTANAVLHLLGGKNRTDPGEMEPEEQTVAEAEIPAFGEEERNMVSGVLTLGERTIRSIMTPRNEVAWINLDDGPDEIREQLLKTAHSFFPVANGTLDKTRGFARARDIMSDLLDHGKITQSTIREALVIPESVDVLQAMSLFKTSRGQMALVVDEYGSVEGLVTPIDILEAIAGEFPDENEQPSVKEVGEGVWDIDGATDLYSVEITLETGGLVDEEQEYSTLNGFLMEKFGSVPKAGQSCVHNNFRFEVLKMDGRRVETVRITRLDAPRQRDER